MKRGLYLSIPSPCKENWDEMVTTENGRFCDSCRKTVIDFSQFTDEQLLAYFKGRKEAVCGRLLNGQLHRPLMPMAPQHRLIPTLLLTAGLLAFIGDATAQKIQTIQTIPTIQLIPKSDSTTTCKAIPADLVTPVCSNVEMMLQGTLGGLVATPEEYRANRRRERRRMRQL